MKSIYFGSVIYPKAIPFAMDFLKSLSRQTFQDYCLLLINDGVDTDNLKEQFEKYKVKNEIVSYLVSYTPAELRINLLREAKKRDADYLILGDIDDTFLPNRIEACVTEFENNQQLGFVYNKFLRMDSKVAMPELPKETISTKDILEFNYLGLSNTAINITNISYEMIDSLIEYKAQVFDWYLFSRLLLSNFIGGLVSDTVTFYRIYEDNYAGIPQMTRCMIEKEIRVKLEHYKALSQYGNIYKELYDAYSSKQYIINSNKQYYYWWNLTQSKALFSN